ncbi:hypothetical protein [Agromyces salentinus]|uniref:N-acetyltransferase n=1 Tax=Agromyces salentinus TaxID=269421 RepID=A0ABP4YT69_9MICO|nr:hypothetical protein [Agromyces salentinus]
MSITFDIRHLAGTQEIELFNRFPYPLNDEIADDLERGRRRPERTWLAVRGDRLLGRLALWSPRDVRTARQPGVGLIGRFPASPALSTA